MLTLYHIETYELFTADHYYILGECAISNFNHGLTFCKFSMLRVPPENNEFEGEIIPCSDFRLGTSQPYGYVARLLKPTKTVLESGSSKAATSVVSRQDAANFYQHTVYNYYLFIPISLRCAARYLDFGLEELVPSLWVESEREYDISAAYGITHWWFRRKEFYINKHSEPSDREAVRSQMRILSVISVKEKDFKSFIPNDFEDLFLLNIQEKLNHLPKTDKTSLHTAVNMWIRNLVIRNRVGDLQLGIESYQTKINLERPNWDAADYYFKEDYTIVP
ncbi:hypothetical protein Tco_0348573 [Tanacetum coccineum]